MRLELWVSFCYIRPAGLEKCDRNATASKGLHEDTGEGTGGVNKNKDANSRWPNQNDFYQSRYQGSWLFWYSGIFANSRA